jgi:hypothetical protein
MTYQTTLFDIDYRNLWFYLGVTKDTYIDFGKSTNSKSVINWEVDIEDRSFGIMRINSVINDLHLNCYWDIMLEDISDICKDNLMAKFDCDISDLHIYGTITPDVFRNYKVINEVEMNGGQMIIMDVLIDFITKEITIR